MAEHSSFGKFKLIRRLGCGGMAEVFHARLMGPAGFSKDIALKLILAHFSDDPEFVRLFIREATLAARLDHGNIVRIHEFDQVDGRHYIAMELVDGLDLRKLQILCREQDRPMRVVEALLIAVEVCQGLAFAHGEMGSSTDAIIHRDISPHNILVSRAGEVKISDFGIAKMATAAGVTETGMIRGKTAYMSPEQAMGDDLDPRSDLFSLGSVIWESLTGQRLFTGSNDMRIIEHIKSMSIRPPSAYNPDVPPEVDAAVMAALERDPDKRVATASAMARQMGGALIKQPGVDRASTLSHLLRSVERTGRGRQTAEMPASPLVPPSQPGFVPSDPEESTLKEEVSGADMPRRGAWVIRFGLLGLLLLSGFLGLWFGFGGFTQVQESVIPLTDAGTAVDGGIGQISSVLVPAHDSSVDDSSDAVDGGQRVDGMDGDAGRAGDLQDVGWSDAGVAAEAKKPKVPSYGYLDLNCIPWAQVYLKGRLLGETPLEKYRLPVGTHRLLLKNASMKHRRTVKVRIRPGKRTRRTIDLR